MAIYFLFSVSCAYFSAHGRAYKKAQSANKRGNYEQAVYASVDALRIKPDYEEVEKILDDAFAKAIRKHHKKIERLKYVQKCTWPSFETRTELTASERMWHRNPLKLINESLRKKTTICYHLLPFKIMLYYFRDRTLS